MHGWTQCLRWAVAGHGNSDIIGCTHTALAEALHEAIELQRSGQQLDAWECHQRVTDMYNWYDIAERTEKVLSWQCCYCTGYCYNRYMIELSRQQIGPMLTRSTSKLHLKNRFGRVNSDLISRCPAFLGHKTQCLNYTLSVFINLSVLTCLDLFANLHTPKHQHYK